MGTPKALDITYTSVDEDEIRVVSGRFMVDAFDSPNFSDEKKKKPYLTKVYVNGSQEYEYSAVELPPESIPHLESELELLVDQEASAEEVVELITKISEEYH